MLRRPALLLVALLVCLAVPAPAGAAEVGGQVERSSPARFPADLAGCRPRCKRGEVIPRGRVLLSRTVRLAPRERRTPVTFRCPRRTRFQTFGFLDRRGADVALQIPDSQLPYTNRRRIRVIAERILQPIGRPSTGTVYALCARRG